MSPARKPGKESKKSPAVENRLDHSQFQGAKFGDVGNRLSNKSEKNKTEQNQQHMDISDQNSSPEIKMSPSVEAPSKHIVSIF